ncbi:hypothetical protein GCM10009715_20420 [Paeniglutamicibacter psychrophenolicus]|uniref:Uncharacterized protein n=1 Tax=Paeniglutamicibacter psychrophenolicus TaxID=257454 RepID=A0ABS4WJB4_9MICC|nr:hypothetical protein [Paeniglutamicibacter psychrophenolicus]MBP2376276.1 hypothetical protein [Paeniglutamicibacter psychrophenolicus]
MESHTYTLQYAGQDFTLTEADHKKLSKIYSSGLSISSVLYRFIPVGEDGEVAIAVGAGAQLVLRKGIPA